jgi:integrase
MRRGVVAGRCSCGSFWRRGDRACGRCGSRRLASWGFYVDTHPRGAAERRKTIRSGFKSKDEAARELLAIMKALESGGYCPPSKEPLGHYLERWIDAKTYLRPTTSDTYAILIERYICNEDFGIGAVPLRALTRPLIRAFYTDVERRGRIRGGARPLSPKAVHNVHLLLRKALEDALEDELIPTNPARRAHKLPTRRPEMKTWTEGQVASFLNFVRRDRLYSLWRTAATTGMRRGELLGTMWADVDLAAGRLHVTRALSKGPRSEALRFGPPKTDRGRRAVPLDPETVKVMRGHRRRQLQERLTLAQAYEDDGLVFCREDGRPLDPDGVSQTFGRVVRRARLPAIRFHDLRHTFATLSLKADPDRGRQPHPRTQEPRDHPVLLPACNPGLGGAGDRAVRLVGRPGRERLESCRYQTGIRAAFPQLGDPPLGHPPS